VLLRFKKVDSNAGTRARYVALLWGINVGGKNMLPMKELVEIFVKAGCADVTTYIQSGNVVFCAEEKAANRLPDTTAKHVEERFGLKVPVVLRTAAALDSVIRENPFLKAGVVAEMLHVFFLAAWPSAEWLRGWMPSGRLRMSLRWRGGRFI
jgi:uncharacterized protein (DUF1697 family)